MSSDIGSNVRPGTFGEYGLTSRYTAETGTVFLSGVQALARLPIDQLRADRDAGLRTAAFISGYPGSPLGGYDGAVEAALRAEPDLPVTHRPAVNEELAAAAVMGAQLASTRPDRRYDGVVGIWYGKGPGVDRAGDAIRHGLYVGSDPAGGAVLLAGDDPNAKSSTIPSSSGGVLESMSIPVLYPADPAGALDLGRHAIALSRATGLWTALKITTDVADGTATVDLDPARIDPVVPLLDGEPYRHRPDGYLLPPNTVKIEREIFEIRIPLAIEYARLNDLNPVTVGPTDAWIGIVSAGITYREVREALHRLGLRTDAEVASAGIRLLHLQMPSPFDPEAITRFARGLTEIVVVEEKRPEIEGAIRDALYGGTHRPRVVGKREPDGTPLFAGHGALTADDVAAGLRRRLEECLGERLVPERVARELQLVPLEVARTPYFCSGCPHNRSARVPEGSPVGAGIGCHAMAAMMDPTRYGDVVGIGCMGSEGSQWIGMAPFVDTGHIFQNIGDGTFFHSGQLAIHAAVAAGVDITYKLLWNRAVAMTGGQEAAGGIPLERVAASLMAHGVSRIVITTDDPDRYSGATLPAGAEVWPRERLMEAQASLRETPGVTVLIHDQQCAAEARRGRKRGTVPTPNRRVVINHRICEGCGDCSDVSNCLSVQPIITPYGRKTTIDQASCNLDYSCLEGDCPAFVTITTSPKQRGKRTRRRTVPTPPDVGGLPDPIVAVDPGDVSIRIAGIGGTGVVTASQLIGTAAMFDGLEVRGLDQTGLSQKAGPVVSDVRITRGSPADSSRLGSGRADVIIAFDQLVAAGPRVLAAADPDRTAVVGSTTVVPTGGVVSHPDTAMPDPGTLTERIAASTRDGRRHWADVGHVTARLLGDTAAANVFVLGMAHQAGYLPMSAASIERAIELNGVAVEANLAAFRWGRIQIVDPDAVAAAAGANRRVRRVPRSDDAARAAARGIAAGDEELETLLAMLAADLTAWQSPRTAAMFLERVAAVAEREREVRPDSTRLTATFARGLHKLTAYKDEYEVARLMLDPDGMRAARELAEATGGRVSWNLHPPLLRSMGRTSKMAFGPRTVPMFGALAKMKWLRGHWFDPFGHSEVRRTERALPGEYVAAMSVVLEDLDDGNFERAVEVAGLPDLVRGYEDVKMRTVAEFRQRLERLLPRSGA